jgi:protein-L-isoaspartate(D-aspartate) O-methyltransferase
MNLVESLIKEGRLKTPIIIEAFKKIKRKDFLPKDSKLGDQEDIDSLAEYNGPVSIGYDETISQPLTVAFMMELMQPKEGDKILDIGSGSGWTTALFAEIVSKGGNQQGKVVGIEIIPELVEFSINNFSKYGFLEKQTAKFVLTDGAKGYSEEAPYDKILCSAALQHKVPDEWFSQLKVGGNMVFPKDGSIFKITKLGDKCCLSEAVKDKDFTKEEYPGFSFVPLISNYE